MPVLELPVLAQLGGLRRFSVAEYHRLIADDYLNKYDKVELIEGYIVLKLRADPPHACTNSLLSRWLWPVVPSGWHARNLGALTLSDSQPEPDFMIVRGNIDDYKTRYPEARDAGILIEVANSTLEGDREDKGRIYARAGIPVYWIVNLIDRHVEVYTEPSGPYDAPRYTLRRDYHLSETIPLILEGKQVASTLVSEIMP